MSQKETNPKALLAEDITSNMENAALTYREKSLFDKTYSATILGTNQKFTDDVSEDDKAAIIQKFSIPEKVEDGDNNYYTFRINGVTYCKKQNGNFKLYDNIMVYIPNGDWSRMYFDRALGEGGNNNANDIDIPNVITAVDAPGGINNNEGNLWIVVNDDDVDNFTEITSENFTRIYEYKYDENSVLHWVHTKCIISEDIPESLLVSEGIYWLEVNNDSEAIKLNKCTEVSGASVIWNEVYPNSEVSYTPTLFITIDYPMKDGDYWVEINNETDRKLEAVYRYLLDEESLCMKWALDSVAGSGGVGENVGKHNERFNDYNYNINNDSRPDSSWRVFGYNHLEGYNNILTDCDRTHIGGSGNSASKDYASHIGGSGNAVSNANLHIVSGSQNNVSGGSSSVVSGQRNTATNCHSSFVGGIGNTVNNMGQGVVVGDSNIVTIAHMSMIAGSGNNVELNNGRVIGAGMYNTCNEGADNSMFCGETNTINGNSSFTCGHHNVNNGSGGILCGSYGQSMYSLAVGNGSPGNLRLIFYVHGTGDVYATGAYNTIGADYAEYFEWADGNPENEDRCGLLVSLEGDRIVPAHGDDILGVVSAAPSVVGNNPQEWRGKYIRDIYGRAQLDADGKGILTDGYDRDRDYIPRSERPEWAAVGLVGRLIVRDNGSCKVNYYCIANNGIAEYSNNKTNVRVLKRIDKSHIEVLIK